MQEFQPDDVLQVVCNPIYVGIPPFPPLMAREAWIEANLVALEEMGAEQYLNQLLDSLHSSMAWAAEEMAPDPADE